MRTQAENVVPIRRVERHEGGIREDTPGVLVDAYRTENYLVVVASLPGRHADQITVELAAGELRLSSDALPGEQAVGDDREYLRQELPAGRLFRSLELPDWGLSLDDAEAHFADGVLTVNVPTEERVGDRKRLRGEDPSR